MPSDATHPRYMKLSEPLLDPDGMITGEEMSRGFTFWNSRRAYRDQAHYDRAVGGFITLEDIPRECPRVFHYLPPDAPGGADGHDRRRE